MKTTILVKYSLAVLFIWTLTIMLPMTLEAQRQGTGSRPSGGNNRQGVSKPNATQGKSQSRDVQKPAGGNKQAARPAAEKKASTQPAGGNKAAERPATGNRNDVSTGNRNNVSTGNKTNVSTGNRNNVNVNNSTNININNSRNTVVVANPRPYPRPPYAYGGHSYYAYHPYAYHPYTPYHYGPPVGFFIAAMAATAIVVTVASQQYHYDQGVYYVSGNGGYTAVPAPIGATVTTLPPGSQTVIINETTNNYYYDGAYYEKKPEGYTVVPPTAGAVVEKLPEGGKEEKIGEVTYVKVGETYYQPITQDGKAMYEVVDVKADGSSSESH